MSATTHSADSGHGHAEASKFHIFVQLAMILAVITGVEIVLIYIPLVKWFIVTSLVILSLVKFMLVIFIFMHLKWDSPFNRLIFISSIVFTLPICSQCYKTFLEEI